MKKLKMIDYPNSLDKIFDKLNKNSITCIIIGGFVRDYFLNISSKDMDIELYNLSSYEKLESLLQEFGSVNSVGKSFGVCKLSFGDYEIDFTLPRVDSKISNGHQGFKVDISSNLDFVTATSRRDFTINAIGFNTKTKKILDPFNGIKDINSKILRAVNNKTFIQDPLRVLRAIQFSSRFNFTLSKELFTLCKKMIEDDMLSQLPKERVFSEMKKLLLKSSKPSIGFNLLKELGTLKYFKELQKISTKNWNLKMAFLDEISNLKTTNEKTNLSLMLSLLCYDFNITDITKFINTLSNEKELLSRVITLVDGYKMLDSLLANKKIEDSNLYNIAQKVKMQELLIFAKAINFSNNDICKRVDSLYNRAKELNILREKLTPILSGKDILTCGLKPSKEFSKILSDAYKAQMNGEFNSHSGAQEWLRSYLLINSPDSF